MSIVEIEPQSNLSEILSLSSLSASLMKIRLKMSGWGSERFLRYVGLRGSTIGFHLLWHTVELAMSTRLSLL